MKKLRFKKIDAFATQQSEGNPAGMVDLDASDDITADEMLRIAKELKGLVSEVGYVQQTDKTTFALKYYSAEREVAFCGHATIAIMYDLIRNNSDLMGQRQIEIITNKGKLVVENKIDDMDAVFISAPDPVFTPHPIDPNRIADALKIDRDDIDRRYPISVVNAGLETLIVPIKGLERTLSLSPVLDELKAFCIESAIDIITVYTDEVADEHNRYRTRVFAGTFGYLEDPATGSGNSALGHYLLKNGMWGGASIALEQNGDLAKPNIIKLRTQKTEGAQAKVYFGGGAIVRIEGEYILQ